VNVVYFAFLQHYGLMAQTVGRRSGQHRSSYHHGDLPNALTDAATEMARQGGPDAVVLRAAAREAGVSAAAAYRHFADHGELLHAVQLRALDALAAAMQASLDSGDPLPDPAQESVRQFRALGAAYIRFALADPGLFRTAFCRPDQPVADAAAKFAARSPFALLASVLDDLVRLGVLDPSRRQGAEIAAWSAVHGLATLLVDGPLALLTADERARAIQRIGDFALDGITAQPAAERASAAQPPADPAFRTGSAG
jgi:AcrR family transcriptional regulator